MGKKETQMSMKKVLEFEDAKSLPPVEQEEEEVETDISSSSFSTPRTVLTTDLFVAKADRFLRAGLNEAAARECVRGLDFKDDEHLRQKFEESVRRISTSLPSTDDCAATVFLELDCQETIIGEPLALNVLVNFPSDDTRTPKDAWIGLFHAPSSLGGFCTILTHTSPTWTLEVLLKWDRSREYQCRIRRSRDLFSPLLLPSSPLRQASTKFASTLKAIRYHLP